MELCNNCKLAINSNKALFPVGTINPEFYILGDMVTQDEVTNNQVFFSSTQAHQYLMNTMNALDMNLDNTRMFKSIRCLSTGLFSNEDFDSCRTSCIEYAKIDIFKTKPKIIISLGKEVTKLLLGNKFRTITSARGRIYQIDIYGEQFKVLPTYSPNYIINNPSFSEQFTKDLNKAKSFTRGELVDIAAKELKWATTYDEFKEYYDNKLINSMTPSYDLETNANDPRSNMARMVGFSLAPNTTTGIYIVRNSLEYKMPEEDWDKIVELTKDYLMSRKVLVHNIMYEGPFTLNEWGVNILDKFEDTLIKARMLRGGDLGGAGLKDQCILNLGYPDWDTDLDNYRSAFLNLMKLLKPTISGKSRWEYTVVRDRGLCALIDEYGNTNPSEFTKDNGDFTREGKVNYYVTLMKDTMNKYYETEADYSIIMEYIGEEICNLIDIKYDGPFSYGFIPMKLIRKYGAMDAVGTQDLNIYLEAQMKKLSHDLGIDLHKGYYYIKRQFIVGTKMELNGLYWNDNIANECEKWYLEKSEDSLRHLLNSDFMNDYLLSTKSWIYNDYLFDNCLDMVKSVFGEIKIYKNFIKLEDGSKIKKSDILSSLNEKLGTDLVQDNRDLVLSLIREQINKCADVWELKSFFNPASTVKKVKDLVNSILVTDDIRIAHLMNKLNVLTDDSDFNPDIYPPGDRDLFKVLIECKKYNKYVEEFNKILDSDESDEDIMKELDNLSNESDIEIEDDENEEESSKVHKIKLTDKDTFDKFYKVLQNVQVKSSRVQQLVGESLNYQLDSLDENSIIEIQKYYLILGINLDDRSTWSKNFEFLFYFRFYKKCMKLRSTYIVGKRVGRGQVWMVPTKDLQSGELLTRRIRKYDGNINPGESCLMQGSFAVCSAETLRWRTGMHTIPAGSDIKNIYTSRYRGGVVFAPDFSQMEIRVMSGAAKCTPMIEAFKAGADIHMENACKIFKKTADQILPAERRYAKMASFMILYGGSPQNFAEEYLQGDLKLANYIYDSFYEAFPEVKIWIDERHKQMKEKGLVTTPMDYFIRITPEKFKGDVNKALRAAQNYPIQSAGSSMAGNVLYELMDYFDKNNLKSKIELFVHDSLEVDTPPYEFLQVGVQIIPLMNKYPMDEFGIPTTADLVVGPSIGQEIECVDIEVNDDFTEGSMTCIGYQDDFDQMFNGFKDMYEICEYTDLEEPKDSYVSFRELFIPKKALNKLLGTTRKKIRRRLHIKYGELFIKGQKYLVNNEEWLIYDLKRLYLDKCDINPKMKEIYPDFMDFLDNLRINGAKEIN